MNIVRDFDPVALHYNLAELTANSYPGRGFVVGRSAVGNLIQVYWLMGRSESSRNRVLRRVQRGVQNIIRAEIFDTSIEDGDPKLLQYPAMRDTDGAHVVTNGRQTDLVINGMWQRGPMHRDLGFTYTLLKCTSEPDAPRISAYSTVDGEAAFFRISRDPLTDMSKHEFGKLNLNHVAAGYCMHTNDRDGDPPPTSHQDPYPVPIGENAQENAELFWGTLNPQNRVSVVAKEIDRKTGKVDYHIINRRTWQLELFADMLH